MTGCQTYTVEEAAQLLGVSRGVGYEAARRGELPTIRLGRRLVVPKIALERMLRCPRRRTPGGDNPGVRETSTIARQEGDHVPSG